MSAPVLPTRVGRAHWLEHDYLGQKVYANLAGRQSATGMLALAISGKLLDADDLSVIDDIASVHAAADPRIWPLKVVRLGSAYGRVLPGVALGVLFFENDRVGHMLASKLANKLCEIRRTFGDDPSAEELEPFLRPALTGADKLPGFGVPFRDQDERYVALEQILQKKGRDKLPYWRLFQRVAAVFRSSRGIEPNALGGMTAALLDAQVPADRVGVFLALLTQFTQYANAVEGAEQAPEILRKLPDDCVEYVGPAPRLSPRAEAARASR